MNKATPIEAAAKPQGLTLAGLLITLGLATELITLFWAHPTSFLTFAFLGGTLVVVGVLRYLVSVLVSPGEDQTGAGETGSP